MTSISPQQTSPLYTPRGKDLALLLLAVTEFVVVIDASIVNVALPSIGRGAALLADRPLVGRERLRADVRRLPAAGRPDGRPARTQADVHVGLVLFSAASFAGGVAQSEGWLLAARATQGLGAAIVSPAALSILATTFAEGAERNRALGVWGATVGAGGRRGRAARRGPHQRPQLALGAVRQRPDRARRRGARPPDAASKAGARTAASTFDFPGAITVTAGLSLLVYAIVDAVNVGWTSSRTLLEIGAAVVLLAAFVIIETRQRHPLMPFTIFRLRTLRGANVVGLLLGMSLFSMFFFISLYLQNVLHYSPIKTGISYLPLAVGIIISAGLASRLVTRIGFKPALIAGLLLITGGLAWFSRVPGIGGTSPLTCSARRCWRPWGSGSRSCQ